ncbi:MAG: helix-turn-helix transcriptional regulator [Clostridia bacterium]|nr:helix-turn-helix transcriptional regulator [Clostridia bacterium]
MLHCIPTFFYPTHIDELKEISQNIIRTFQCDKRAQILQNKLQQFLFLLLSDSFENAASQIKEKSSRIHTVTSYIAEHYAEKLDMDYLASLIHLDKCYFIRYFKKKTGMTPQQYLIQKRLQEAKALLSRIDLPVSEIAYIVGYSNVTYFVSSFKKHVGISPNQYRTGFLD